MRGSLILVALLAGSTAVAQPGPTPTPEPSPTPTPPDEEPPVPADTPPEPAPAPGPEPPPPPAPVVAAPVAVDAAPAPDGAYPLALAQRPLALPRGMFELVAYGQIADSDFFEQDPIDGVASLRAGLGMIELEAGATMHLRDASEGGGPDALGLVRAAARYVVHPDLTVGVEGQMFQPTMEDSQFAIIPGVGYKLRLSDVAAVETRGSVSYTSVSFGGESDSLVSLVAGGRLQIAATPQLSAEFATDLYIYVVTPDDLGYPFTSSLHSLRGLFAASKHLDVFAGLQTTGFSEFQLKYVSLGVQGRLP
jgi:hypothetical protein